LDEATSGEREKWLCEDIQIPAFSLRHADFTAIGKKTPRVDLSFGLDLHRYASIAGTRLLFQPNLMERRTYVPPMDTLRKQPIVHSYAYLDIDTVLYTLPEGFTVEALPKPVVIETAAGRYASSIRASGPSELLYSRRLEIVATELPREMYEKYRLFWGVVANADKAVAAIVRK